MQALSSLSRLGLVLRLAAGVGMGGALRAPEHGEAGAGRRRPGSAPQRAQAAQPQRFSQGCRGSGARVAAVRSWWRVFAS